tara:strand:- start:2638 stop:3717 length:1080 start_codon:yes stop_codon:yes gene_type:complete
MNKSYNSLGLMSGTSGDGIDASVIETDGKTQYKVLKNQFFEYPFSITRQIHKLKEEITNPNELLTHSKDIELIAEQITDHHANAANEMINKHDIDLIGFHGQTIYHNSDQKISKQIGSGEKLSKITKKTVICNFRENDLNNGGEGAPLAPIFHKLLVKQNKIKIPVSIINIGGISNITSINNNFTMYSRDIGPGNCLIDKWIRLKSKEKYDEKGSIARSGTIDKFILNQSLDNFYNNEISKKKSFDTNDFDLSFARGLNLENGAATLTEFTADICSKKIVSGNIYVSGGGRKNTFLIERLEKKTNSEITLIDEMGIDGDFIESQAFAYLAVRSFLKLPISFPETTGCSEPCSGGKIFLK